MSTETHYRKLERMYHSAPVNRFFAAEMRVSEGTARVTIEVAEKFFHSAGAVHGSVYFKALDDAAFFAVSSREEEFFVLTVSFNTYLTRPIRAGAMIATGRVVHASRRIFLAESQLVDGEGREIARGSGSFMKSEILLSDKLGYDLEE